MPFDPSQHNRAVDGRFSQKNGSAPEVNLAVEPQVPRGHTLFRNYTSKWGRYSGWSESELKRINSFVERHDMRVSGKHTGRATADGAFYKDIRYHMTDGRVIKAGRSEGDMAAQRAVADLITTARIHQRVRGTNTEVSDFYAAGDKLAQEVFGDEYDAMVARPQKSFLQRVFGD